MAQLKSTTVDGTLSVSSDAYLNNAKFLFYKNTNGTDCILTGSNSSNNLFFGYGSYNSSIGASYLDGHAVNIRSNGAIYISSPTAKLTEREYGVNKILWSGGAYMNASQTATLSQAISAQPHGIVLVWSLYGDGAAHNNNWNSFFIPKQLIASHGGSSFSMFIVRANLASCCQKSLAIQDTKITGVATNNQAAATSSSITNSPNTSVLRYVIGV